MQAMLIVNSYGRAELLDRLQADLAIYRQGTEPGLKYHFPDGMNTRQAVGGFWLSKAGYLPALALVGKVLTFIVPHGCEPERIFSLCKNIEGLYRHNTDGHALRMLLELALDLRTSQGRYIPRSNPVRCLFWKLPTPFSVTELGCSCDWCICYRSQVPRKASGALASTAISNLDAAPLVSAEGPVIDLEDDFVEDQYEVNERNHHGLRKSPGCQFTVTCISATSTQLQCTFTPFVLTRPSQPIQMALVAHH